MCVPSMGIWYPRYHIIPEGASPLQASWRSLLVSRKLVFREGCSAPKGWLCQRKRDYPEGMPLAQNPVLTNSPHRDAYGKTTYGGINMWVSKHIFATPLACNLYCVDVSGIGGRNMLLPGEVSCCLEHWEKSAEVIVVMGNEP